MGALLTLALAPAAEADVTSVFNGGETPVPCAPKADGIRVCQGVTETFDGVTNIDVNVILPPASQGDGPFPAIGWFHGWGGAKLGVNGGNAAGRAAAWASRGYAVFSMSDRGWGGSCGAMDPKRISDPAGCANGYIHLMDTRFEVRDAQHLFGVLADEGRIIPDKIGVTGGSYGGGISMAMAALRNRIMRPDDSLVPWTSPNGKPMQIAVAVPEIPWTDLAYSLQPNGRTLDYVANNSYLGPDGDYPIGVIKQSFVAGLYALGQASGNYPVPGTDPDADLTTWYALINAGEPYDQSPLAADITDEIMTHHSSYYISRTTEEYGTTAPAPILISNGWTDDLFPPDEAIRFYNRTRSEFPENDISMYFLDYGHQRGQSKGADVEKLQAVQETWFDHYLKGSGPKPEQGATAITQTCGGTEDNPAPSAGPFTAPTWDELSAGEIQFTDASSKTIAPGAGNPESAQAFDPSRGRAHARPRRARTFRAPRPTGSRRPRPAASRCSARRPSSRTSLRRARPRRLRRACSTSGRTATKRLSHAVSTRPESESRQVFQLHPNGWKFEADHIPKLELLAADTPYGRTSNGQGPVTVENLELRLPVREKIGEPAPSVLPDGTQPAPGVTAAGPCESGLSQKGTKRNDRLKGTAGGDRLRGGKGNDKVSGKDGDDCLSGGRGKDRVAGGNGNDTVKVRDKERDRVNCGKGKDKVTADRKDKLRGCEKKKRK